VAELAGSLKGLPTDLDGVSLRPLLDDSQADVKRPYEGLIFHYPHFNRVGLGEPHSAIRYGKFKLIHFPVSARNLLFNLAEDVGERRDLSAEMPELVALLEEKLGSYLTQVDAERPEETDSWVRAGREGKARTGFFERYGR
jgi:arylsulfatase A-like enzyme